MSVSFKPLPEIFDALPAHGMEQISGDIGEAILILKVFEHHFDMLIDHRS